jgi:hypothetical protein
VEIAGDVTGSQGAVLPICGEQQFLVDLKREGYTCEMLILPNRIRRLAFFAVFCVAWFNAAVGRPVEALSAVKKTVLVLHGDRLSIPAVKTDGARFDGWPVAWAAGRGGNFSEYLDLSRFPAAQYGDDLVRYLRAQLDGSAYLQACLASHLPVDLVVIMLGSNDLKRVFNRTPLRIAIGAARLIDLVNTLNGGVGTSYKNPKVLLICCAGP